MKIDLYLSTGEKKGQIELNPQIFAVKSNPELVRQALLRQMANNRKPVAHTKDRSEVRGGGRKPYRQKGTGRARQGSIRSPLFKGGGVTFGPRNDRNFTKNLPKKQRRKALFIALSDKAKAEQIIALESYENREYKTKKIVELIEKLPVEKNILIVMPEKNEHLERSSRNVPYVKTLLVNYLNLADLKKYHQILFLKEALKKLEDIFLKEKIEKPKEEKPTEEKKTKIKKTEALKA